MAVEWFRDLVIALTGLVVSGVFIFFAVISYSMYVRVRRILDSAEAISSSVQKIAACLDGVAKPLFQIAAIVQGLRQSMEAVADIFKRREKQ